MFIKNKYSKWYFSIVHRAMSRNFDKLGYIEKHHIIPKSLGGNNDATNLVCLTAKEHFICHLLLPKMTSGDQKRKMVYAAWRMAVQKRPDQSRYRVSSKLYEMIKTQRSAYLKTLVGPLNPNFGNKTGRTSEDFTPEWRAKISASRKGKSSWNKGISRTDAVKEAVSKANKGRKTPGFTGRKHSEETKEKIAETFARKKLLLAC
jgi:predicted HNH restriction endonuclease